MRIKATWYSLKRFIQQLLGVRRAIPDELDRFVRGVADDSELIFRAFAPRESGRLHRGIRAIVQGNVALVQAHARNPRTGYDYVRVTRIGHFTARITPRADRRPASVVETQNPRQRGGQAALRFTAGGQVLYRRSVRGFKPASDWASDAMPQIQMVASDAAEDAGRRIVTRFG